MNCSSNFKLKLSHYFIIYKQNNRGCLIYPGNIGNPILMQKKACPPTCSFIFNIYRRKFLYFFG